MWNRVYDLKYPGEPHVVQSSGRALISLTCSCRYMYSGLTFAVQQVRYIVYAVKWM